MITRRTFVGLSAVTAAAIASRDLSKALPVSKLSAPPVLDPNTLAPYVDALPLPSVAQPQGYRPDPAKPGEKIPFYRVHMRAIACKLHRDLPPTSLWSFGGSVPGVTFETRSNQGMFVEWVNDLPRRHFLPIDHSLHGAERTNPEVRSVVHLHGGKTPADSDGYPEDWYEPGQSRTYYYPNQQEAALLWYHDHAMGINRLNIYAGLMGLHIIRDEHERQLHLPEGKYEIPLVLFDRHLQRDGQLTYPVSSDSERPWVSELLGEIPLVNGCIFPYLDVEPRKYRFRVLNGANGRYFRMSLPGGVEIYQIGSDQGLLPAPVAITQLQLAPGERADIVIDFAQHRGASLVLSNDAFDLMQFRVGATPVADHSVLPATLRAVPRLAEASAIKTRWLTLDEQAERTVKSTGMLLNNTPWHMPITEKPVLGSTEIWQLVNTTEDVHPIHLHMVRFQILDRRPFDAFHYTTTGIVHYTGPVAPPDPEEMGWKDTVRASGQSVTRIIVPFVGYAGRYVWHCHNLEHEDNEMMRPYEVVAS